MKTTRQEDTDTRGEGDVEEEERRQLRFSGKEDSRRNSETEGKSGRARGAPGMVRSAQWGKTAELMPADWPAD